MFAEHRPGAPHGHETGRGEYAEVHEPLTRGELYRLTAHEEPKPYELGPKVDADGAVRRFTVRQRLRARLARAMYGPGTYVPKATPEEYRALHAGWHESERLD
ncbi:hypothetical protein GTW43_01210 [Streptomyces sp. SID5785]|uniref:hypothetical protein n=1 Tax=Streptomyces sp. SID5785 TaxID=2690309 RepID=UPI001361973D|nr:hypothetical protein [Streptomyces sp. SID5785]MZD03706.1 hypothetical protein [Streptomyces sp. SID5785]